jgi:hypothetical protein
VTAVAKRATVFSPLAFEKLPECPILQLPVASFPPEYESQKSDACHGRTSASEGIALLAFNSVLRLDSDQDGSRYLTREPFTRLSQRSGALPAGLDASDADALSRLVPTRPASRQRFLGSTS